MSWCQNIKNINQFETRLSVCGGHAVGNLRKEPVFPLGGQCSSRWKAPTWQSAWERTRGFTVLSQQVTVTLVEGVEVSGIDVVLRISVEARSQETNWEMIWLKQLLMWVSFTCLSSLSFIAMTSKTGAWSGLCQSPASIDISLSSGHIFVDYSSIIFQTVSSDLLHHWERPLLGGRGSLEMDVWIYSN